MTKPYAIYLRQSRDFTGAGLAVERQLEDCRVLATRLDLEGEEVVYVDNDVSASNTKKRRPGYEALMAALRAGAHDTLLCWHNDRLHRRPVELEEFIAVVEATNLTIRTVQAGDIDLSTPTGRLVARIVGAVARQEVEHKGQRQRAALRQRAFSGDSIGARRRFGFGRSVMVNGRIRPVDAYEENPREADAIRVAFERIIAGEAPRTIWHGWNDEGLLTARGYRWTATTFTLMMRRASLAGLVIYRGEILDGVQAAWPAIVDPATFYAAQTRMGVTARHQRTAWRGICDGFVQCEYCRGSMRVHLRPVTSGARIEANYLCRAKKAQGHVMMSRHLVDDAVFERLVQVLARRRVPLSEDTFRCLHPDERGPVRVAAQSFGRGHVEARKALGLLGLTQHRALARMLFDVTVRKSLTRPRVLITVKGSAQSKQA